MVRSKRVPTQTQPPRVTQAAWVILAGARTRGAGAAVRAHALPALDTGDGFVVGGHPNTPGPTSSHCANTRRAARGLPCAIASAQAWNHRSLLRTTHPALYGGVEAQ